MSQTRQEFKNTIFDACWTRLCTALTAVVPLPRAIKCTRSFGTRIAKGVLSSANRMWATTGAVSAEGANIAMSKAGGADFGEDLKIALDLERQR